MRRTMWSRGRARLVSSMLQQMERPGFWRRRVLPRLAAIEIQILLQATARAFRQKGRRVWHLPPGKALREYAAYSAACMRRERRAAKAAAE